MATTPKMTKKPDEVQTQAVQAYDFSNAPTGFENVNREDLGVPFLQILQKGSPQIDKTHKEYATKRIEDAEVGDIINTVTNEVLAQPVTFIPCTYEKLYVEWTPRDKGGGIVKSHRDANILLECTRDDKGHDILKNGNLVVTTAYFGGLVVHEDGSRVPAVVSFTSTQLKKARFWLQQMMNKKLNGKPLPMFSHAYSLTTIPESNNKGSWMGWKIDNGAMQKDPVLIAECIDTAKRAAALQRTALPPSSEGGDEAY